LLPDLVNFQETAIGRTDHVKRKFSAIKSAQNVYYHGMQVLIRLIVFSRPQGLIDHKTTSVVCGACEKPACCELISALFGAMEFKNLRTFS